MRVVLGIFTAVVILISGCATTKTSDADRELPAKNIDSWALPLDAYGVNYLQGQQQNYAENVLIGPCMERAGYVWNLPAMDPDKSQGESYNDYSRRVFTRELAMKWGYHEAPARNASAAAEAAFGESINSIPPAEQSAFDSCLEEARQSVPNPKEAGLAQSYGISAYLEALKDPTVKGAAEKWRECMLPLGISDLPDSPTDFPTPSLDAEFGFSNQDGANPGTATDREREVALADFDCQESSGYRQASYDAEWNGQVGLIRENADALEEAAAVIASMKVKVAKVINEAAGRG